MLVTTRRSLVGPVDARDEPTGWYCPSLAGGLHPGSCNWDFIETLPASRMSEPFLARANAPERLLDQSHPHPHGQLEMTVEGESVNFTQDKYTMTSEACHFHGDEGAAHWHAHSRNVTVGAALSRFSGVNVSDDSVIYDGTTHRLDGTSNAVTVNGEPVDPNTYVVKDGDNVRVTLDETGL